MKLKYLLIIARALGSTVPSPSESADRLEQWTADCDAIRDAVERTHTGFDRGKWIDSIYRYANRADRAENRQ